MRVRMFELRLIAVALTALWGSAAGLVLVGYHPGGPIDLVVGLAACLAVPIPIVALIWPPVARGPNAFAAVVWVGLAAGLFLIPSIGGLLDQIVKRGPQTLFPSVEAAYAWTLALLATSLFAGLGVARRVLGWSSLRRDRLAVGMALAFAGTMIVGLAFAGAALANDVALRDTAARSSRFGPTLTDVQPPLCDDPLRTGTSARIAMTLEGEVDLRTIGTARLSGTRSGRDVRWIADVATDRALGTFGAARIAGRGWLLLPRARWTSATPAAVADIDLDLRAFEAALQPGARTAAEDRGLEYVEGARARHCRVAVDGASFEQGFPELRWLAGAGADLHRWRGRLDYWVFLDGELGRLDGEVSGPASALDVAGIAGVIRVTMTAVDRDVPLTVSPPQP